MTSHCFPKLFATVRAGQFKIYQNSIEKSFDTLGIPANVLWPLDDVSISSQLTFVPPFTGCTTTCVKKWNGRHYRSCKWSYVGSQVILNIDGDTVKIPVVTIFEGEESKLPYNSFEVTLPHQSNNPNAIFTEKLANAY